MTKKKTVSGSARSDASPRASKPESGGKKSPGNGGSAPAGGGWLDSWRSMFAPAAIREVVESVVIAFVLAFLFRTFEAEAFVIPTGSMAPTLMGRHKDVACEKCGFEYQASASSEVDPRSGNPAGNEVVSGTCPLCRYTMDLRPGNPQRKKYPSFTGDRILVGKFPYQFHDPERWDVAVFRYPGGATTNYIKRIVGLPRETLRIRCGDLWVKRDGQQEFAIARKPPEKIRAVLQPVYDNDYLLPKLIEQGWPARWAAEGPASAAGAWRTDNHRTFATDGSASAEVWLRYRHVVPSADDWKSFQSGTAPPAEVIRPQLISDFTAYNTDAVVPSYSREAMREQSLLFGEPAFAPGRENGQPPLAPSPQSLGLHWVGDLAVELVMDVQGPSGTAILELVRNGYRCQCAFDLAKGTATLSISGREGFHPTAATAVRGPGTYRIMLANVDQQLTLWVNNRVVRFDAATTYDPLGDEQPQQADLLSPVGVASRGAALRVDHLKVFRDIYYIADRDDQGAHYVITDFDREHFPYRVLSPDSVAGFLSTPAEWDAFRWRREVEFHLDADQFLVLGDNSAESKDSRLWGKEYYVKRDLLIGKALFIYWPHSWDKIPYLNIPFPFFPNFARMKFVR